MIRVPRARSLLALVVLALSAGCTGEPPEILFPDASLSLLRDPATGQVAEVLRVFAGVRDPDGPDDVARVLVLHDEAELVWELTESSWTHVEYGGDHWYGAYELRAPEGASLPRGRYGVVAEDQGLATARGEFFLTAEISDPAELTFPELVVRDGSYRIDAVGPVVLRVYSRAGQMVVEEAVGPGTVPDTIASRIPRETGVVAYLTSVGDGPRLESGPWNL